MMHDSDKGKNKNNNNNAHVKPAIHSVCAQNLKYINVQIIDLPYIKLYQ